ncbi:MAG: RluA family pseudouridine synthase [Clostridium sp.]
MDEMIFTIDENFDGERIDKYLARVLEGKSRSFLQGVIEKGNVKVNEKIVKSNYKLKVLDEVSVDLPEPIHLTVEPEDIPIEIIYEDNDVIVVNKPQGMVVHPAPGNYTGTLVNALLYHCNDLSSINGVIRPGIVHRIDKDTTGVLVVAKNDEAHNKLSAQLKDHSMKREYYALVEGKINSDGGTIDKPLARSKRDRLKIAIMPEGRRAVTHYEVLERFRTTSLVKCVLETGRTHQIRVHMSSIGYPLVGDPLYGFSKTKFRSDGQMLHAKTLGFIHPSTNEYMEFTTELPSYFNELIDNLRKVSNI